MAEFYIDFKQWTGNPYEHDGDICDGFPVTGSRRRCDPTFTFCFSKASDK